MSTFTLDDVIILRQIPDLCPNVELEGSTERFREYMTDLTNRVAVLAPKPFSPFELKCHGVGEVIQPDDPRHPKYQK